MTGHCAAKAAFAAALLDPALPVPAGVVSPRGTPDAARFAVHRNNVFVALVAALEARFPVTARLVGDAFFRAMARLHADARKPSSPLMFEYGGGFPDFIAGFPPARGLPYLADVARLEVAWSRAYHAAEAEPLALEALSVGPPEALLLDRLAAHPAAALVTSAHPIGSIWSAHQGPTVAPVADWRPEAVLVTRPAATVQLHILPPGDAPFAAALLAGATIGAAAEAALAGAAGDGGFDPGRALVGLVRTGAFTARQTATERTSP
ncbi:DNA-binding domain-containing protein [Arenibaculum sp.]|jgi:hypothetical protein|uniref:DNA-binding domain-containing protein n=1 Tax=Arenibaculum sp. TaxID=2865862 RepID=UPI002E14A3E2|nr:DNA-binding domain-containing protein [Arenibaculum sp.]